MKRLWAFVIVIITISGCQRNNEAIDRALKLRSRITGCNGCAFEVQITADYEDEYYTFKMLCSADREGNITFEVKEPSTISGIKGKIDADGGKILFDEDVLVFPTLIEGELTPVSAPWILVRMLKSAYISGCGNEDEGLLISLQDTYHDEVLQAEIITDHKDVPTYAEFFWKSRRVLTLSVDNFQFL